MREQSERNLFDSETLGLQREAFYTQRQLAMHSLRDRAQARIDYNQGLAEAANARAMQAEATVERRLIDSARQMPAVLCPTCSMSAPRGRARTHTLSQR